MNETLHVAVVGAHMLDEPLNHELTDRHASLRQVCRTAPCYQLFLLPTIPPKPGLLRVVEGGDAIEIEVWEMPASEFGSFVSGIPHPLGIGSIELESGDWVKGFLCEACATETAENITHTGGWRYRLA